MFACIVLEHVVIFPFYFKDEEQTALTEQWMLPLYLHTTHPCLTGKWLQTWKDICPRKEMPVNGS